MFLGIPHIEPPIGDLRFRKPEVYEKKWNGILDTKEFKPACMSNPVESYLLPNGGPVSEDCLYINVYTNSYCLEHKNCSIMVAVHGGRMLRGSTATYHSDVIINNFVGQNRNIVVVTVPYRLGIFGLPNLEGNLDGVADRNLLLYDVIEGLKWMKREISNFGGDSNKTTYFGHSGGGSIGLVLGFLTEYDHLYQKAIFMSPPLLAQSKISNSKLFVKVATHVGCYAKNDDNKKIFDCMRTISAEKLRDVQDHVFRKEEESFADFAIDGKLIGDNPRKLLKNGNFSKKPLLIGTVPYEVRYTQYIKEENGKINGKDLLELCELFGFAGAYQKPYEFVEKCVEFYMKNDTYEYLVDDYIFHMTAGTLAQHHASEQPVYLYSYTYSGIGEGFTDYVPNSTAPSPIHSEDFVYLLGVHRSSKFTQKDFEIEQIFSGMIANFVNFGKPNGRDWDQLNPEIMNYFEINFDKDLRMPGMKYEFHKKNLDFWNSISPEAAGNFSFREEFPKSFDVFPVRDYVEMKNIFLKSKYWDADKNINIAEKTIPEIEKFIANTKKSRLLCHTGKKRTHFRIRQNKQF